MDSVAGSIFISYSNKDKIYLKTIKEEIQKLEIYRRPIVNSDQEMKGGDRWYQKIKEWLNSADIIILLISNNFNESSFIEDKEIPIILGRLYDKSDNVIVYPIMLNSFEDKNEGLKKILLESQAKPSIDVSLNDLHDDQIDDAIVKISKEIVSHCKSITNQKLNFDNEITVKHDTDNDIDINIEIFQRGNDHFRVEFRKSSRSDEHESCVIPYGVCLRQDELDSLNNDTEKIGRLLGNKFFPEFTDLSEGSTDLSPHKIVSVSQQQVEKFNEIYEEISYLNLQVSLSPDVQHLHSLPWESIYINTEVGLSLSSEFMTFSRHLAGNDEKWRECNLRKRPQDYSKLKSLSVIGMKKEIVDINKFHKSYTWKDQQKAEYREDEAKIDTKGWLKEIEASSTLISTASNNFDFFVHDNKHEDFSALTNCLQNSHVDFLYITVKSKKVCKENKSEYSVTFWKEDGAHYYDVGEISEALIGLRNPPRIVILSTLGSSEDDIQSKIKHTDVLIKLGDLIAKTGVPAVLILTGQQSQDVKYKFLYIFFKCIKKTDYSNVAFSLATRFVEKSLGLKQLNYILLTRMRTSRVWYKPGLQGKITEVNKTWRGLINSIKEGKFLPIVGTGVARSIAGTSKEFSRACAYDCGYALEFHNRLQLTQVIQYLKSVHYDGGWETKLSIILKNLIKERNRDRINFNIDQTELSEAYIHLGKLERKFRKDNDLPLDAYSLLSKSNLNIGMFIVANMSGLLQDALEENGRSPVQIDLYKKVKVKEKKTGGEENFDDPSVSRPWMINVFGSFKDITNAILTEDQYLEFLVNYNLNSSASVMKIKRNVSEYSVIFLGFKPDQWNFKILYQIWKSNAMTLNKKKPHIAVQVDPDDHFTIDPHGAKQYLNRLYPYPNFSIYWGSSEDFLNELWDRLN